MSTLLEKIGLLLRQAESAGTEEEALTYTQKAQMLASREQIELAQARAAVAHREKREEPEQRTLWFGEIGKKNTKTHLVNLYSTIASANDVKINIYGDSSGVIAFGFPSDIEVVDLLFGSLAAQMIEAGDIYIKSGEHKTETVYREKKVTDSWGFTSYEWGEFPVDGRTARASFYRGFTDRIGDRLLKARREARIEAEAAEKSQAVLSGQDDAPEWALTGTALVLAAKAEEVGSFYHKTSRAKGSWKGYGGGHSSSGHSAGRAAGDRARISSARALAGSRTAVTA